MDVKTTKLPWDDTAFIVVSRDGELNPYLRAWLDRHQIELTAVRSRYGLACERNASVEQFLRSPMKLGNLCLLDRDKYPVAETEAILKVPGDLVYCGYVNRKRGCFHFGDGDLGAGCMRVSRKVLLAMKPPWFEFEYNDRGTAVTRCECGNFLKKAKAVNFDSKMVGVIGHLIPMVARPNPGDPTKIVVTYPDDYGQMVQRKPEQKNEQPH